MPKEVIAAAAMAAAKIRPAATWAPVPLRMANTADPATSARIAAAR